LFDSCVTILLISKSDEGEFLPRSHVPVGTWRAGRDPAEMYANRSRKPSVTKRQTVTAVEEVRFGDDRTKQGGTTINLVLVKGGGIFFANSTRGRL
jgi:hypothetical protein